MKNILSFIAIIILLSNVSMGQNSCRVLFERISESYEGECKDGFANGEGVAMGVDQYEGKFKNGYPHGKGTYRWSTGEIYTGEWKMGKRNGEGTYTYQTDSMTEDMSGIWENDIYQGIKAEKPKIISKKNIVRAVFKRLGDGNEIRVNIYVTGSQVRDATDVSITATNGVPFSSGSTIGYGNIEFPFKCTVSYCLWAGYLSNHKEFKDSYNKERSYIEFEITQPGRWQLDLNNN
jgi:radial spoke head protein 1